MNTDSIIIPRSDLPEVIPAYSGGGLSVGGWNVEGLLSAKEYRERALRDLALAEYKEAQEPAPLTVNERVKVVWPYYADGERASLLAPGDVGTVIIKTDVNGNIGFQRDGTIRQQGISAENVERVEDDSPAVGDVVRVNKAERADGGSAFFLPQVGREYRVCKIMDGGNIALEQVGNNLHLFVAARHVTVIKRAER